MIEEPVFCNDNIQVGNRCICCKNQIDNGVFYIKTILNENSAFMTFTQFKKKYEVNIDYVYWLCTSCQEAVYLKQE